MRYGAGTVGPICYKCVRYSEST